MEKGPLLAAAIVLLLGMTTVPAASSTGYHTDSGSAFKPASSYYVSAPVISATPIHSTRTREHPIRHCSSATPPRSRYPSRHRDNHYQRSDYQHGDGGYFFQGLLGGLVGGFIGNQFGGGNGKKALTVVGALAGSSIAREAARQRHYHDTPSQVCHTRYETELVEEVSGWDVTYSYAGKQFSKRMTEHPGESVRIRVEVTAGGEHD
jgi:uncharacterized protein YcfJ